MIALRPFFLLVGRASVFWIGLAAVVGIGFFVAGVSQDDTRLRAWVDAAFVAAFAFPTAAGWLAGGVIQEAQHTSFLGSLPGVRGRLAPGYLLTGIAIAAVIATLLYDKFAPGVAVAFVVAFASYCFGGSLAAPGNAWISSVATFVLFAAIGMSVQLTRIAAARPVGFVAVALAGSGVAVWWLFAPSTFRSAPFRPATPFPGRFFAERSRRFERERQRVASHRRVAWRGGYLGDRPWPWVRAAFYQVHGPLSTVALLRKAGRLWALLLLPLVYTWADKGDLPFPRAFGWCVFDGLFRSPHHPPFGEAGGPYAFFVLAIAAVGAVTALIHPTILRPGLGYPLARRMRAAVLYRCGLVDSALVLLGGAALLYAIGIAMAWLAGFTLYFDYLPLFVRALLVTAVLMPLAHMGYLRLGVATVSPDTSPMAVIVFSVITFVLTVALWVFVAPRILPSQLAELVLLVALLPVTQAVYRESVHRLMATADLA